MHNKAYKIDNVELIYSDKIEFICVSERWVWCVTKKHVILTNDNK